MELPIGSFREVVAREERLTFCSLTPPGSPDLRNAVRTAFDNLYKSLYLYFMEKVLKITTLKEEQSDFQYWTSQPEERRLEAIEILRDQYINFRKDVQQGLQRVCTITNTKQS